MPKITNISKAREKRTQKDDAASRHEGFQPCSPDMTICGDCQDNRAKNKCPVSKSGLQNRDCKTGRITGSGCRVPCGECMEERIQKILSAAGIASRRAAEEIILDGGCA